MLAADKLQLQSALKQQATALKEKEFNLHHSNLMTVGTQAAVLAGLNVTMFIEFTPPPNSEWQSQILARAMKMAYYTTIVSAFCANMMVVSHTTALSVLGAGLALRGPDGSMFVSTDGLYEERTSVFYVFGVGLACTVGAITLAVVVILPLESAVIALAISLYTARTIYCNYRRVLRRFDFDERDTVDFRDIMEGPGSIHVRRARNRKSSTVKSKSSFRKEEMMADDDDDALYDDDDYDIEECHREDVDLNDLISSDDNHRTTKTGRQRRLASRSDQRQQQEQQRGTARPSQTNSNGSASKLPRSSSSDVYKIQTV